jgi:site-specific DNA recombinase
MLTNPFYYGHFRYFGEIHEGKHKAIISKKLFDEAQATLAKRGRPQKGATAPQIFCGFAQMCNV